MDNKLFESSFIKNIYTFLLKYISNFWGADQFFVILVGTTK